MLFIFKGTQKCLLLLLLLFGGLKNTQAQTDTATKTATPQSAEEEDFSQYDNLGTRILMQSTMQVE